MAKKKEEPQIKVANRIALTWLDDEGNQHEYVIRLRRPKGRTARQFMPKVLKFLTDISDYQARLDSTDLAGQARLIEMFEEHEAIFPFILQIEDDKEAMRIVEKEFVLIELMEPIFQAAQYIVAESLNRPEVQEALKKSDGDAPKDTPEEAS